MTNVSDILQLLQTSALSCYRELKDHIKSCDNHIKSVEEKGFPDQKKIKSNSIILSKRSNVKFKAGRSASLPFKRKIQDKTKIKFLNRQSNVSEDPMFITGKEKTKSFGNTLNNCAPLKSEILQSHSQLTHQCKRFLNSSVKNKTLNVVINPENAYEVKNFAKEMLNSGIQSKTFNSQVFNTSKFPSLPKIHVHNSSSCQGNSSTNSKPLISNPKLMNVTDEIVNERNDEDTGAELFSEGTEGENSNSVKDYSSDKTPIKKLSSDKESSGELNHASYETPIPRKSFTNTTFVKRTSLLSSKTSFSSTEQSNGSESASNKIASNSSSSLKNNSNSKVIKTKTKFNGKVEKLNHASKNENVRCLRPRNPERKCATKQVTSKSNHLQIEKADEKKSKRETRLKKAKEIKQLENEKVLRKQTPAKINCGIYKEQTEEKRQKREARMKKAKETRQKLENEKLEKNILKAQENNQAFKTKMTPVICGTKSKFVQKNNGVIPKVGINSKKPQLESVKESGSNVNSTFVKSPSKNCPQVTQEIIASSKPVLNSTFVKNSPIVQQVQHNADGVFKKPTGTPLSNPRDSIQTNKRSQKSSEENYEMTPYRGDSDDDDDDVGIKKPVPSWASGLRFKDAIIKQEYNRPNLEKLFGLLPNNVYLEEIFGKNGPYRKKKRTSSAVWKNFSFTLDV